MRNTRVLLAGMAAMLSGCGSVDSGVDASVQQFLTMYNQVYHRLYTVDSQAQWRAATDVSEQHTGERIGADEALASFQGSKYVIDNSRRFLADRDALSELEFRELDKILLTAAESPGTIPDVVQQRIQAEARLSATLDGFTFCLDRRGQRCLKSVTPNQIDQVLLKSNNLAERRRYWEVSKQSGPALKQGLAELRDLRNRVAKELGYTSYFHLQVADYGMSVDEMMQLMDTTLEDVRPLYQQLHLYARRRMARRFHQAEPEMIPAHWIGNRWGQQWPGIVQSADLDPYFQGKAPQWIVEQAERFYTSLGMPPLPRTFWERSDLYQLPPDSTRKKNTHASAWHIDLDQDVRSLMSVVPNFQWFVTSHHELGHINYFLAYSKPEIPYVLRDGLNRAFHEAVGDLIAIAARQQPYLKQTGILPASVNIDPTDQLLDEALDNAVVFLPFAAGTMTHFERDLYEKNLPIDEFNKRWWELVEQYQRIEPPSERGEDYCDACTKTHIIDDPAQYYDYAIAVLLKYQLHDYIARKILKQDPHNCNYYGNKEVGEWLMSMLSLGATRDWRTVLKEMTGEDLSPRAFLAYFQPLQDYLVKVNAEPASAPGNH